MTTTPNIPLVNPPDAVPSENSPKHPVLQFLIASGVIGAVVGALTASVLAHGWPDPPSVVVVAPSASDSPSSGAPTLPRSTPPTEPAPSLEPTPTPTRTAATASASTERPTIASVAVASISTSSDDVSATVEVASLDNYLTAVGRARYNVRDAIINAYGDQCVETVVVNGLTASTASVISSGWPHGLDAAEDYPSQSVESGEVHQQIQFLPESALQSPRSIGGTLVIGHALTPLGAAELRLMAVDEGVATISLDGTLVRCGV